MKVIAAITADFEHTFLGLPARLETDLRGESIIRRTLKQLRRTPGLASIHLLVDKVQGAVARSAVGDLDVAINIHSAGPPPWRKYVASGRKWSLDGWRGGLAGTTVYDEFNHPWLLQALARQEKADAIVDVPAAAPLLDPQLLGQLIGYYQRIREETRLALVQSAPGLSAIMYHPELLAGLCGVSQPPGRSMAYRPDDPHHDAIHQPCWYAADATIAHGCGRCIADTGTSWARLEAILSELCPADTDQTPDALTVSRWLASNGQRLLGSLPREVEIETTTQDPLADSPLRPRGAALERHGEMDIEIFRRIIDELSTLDDRLIVLGGFGDPLLHPQWPEFIRYARKCGILGVALRTSGVHLDARAIDNLLECEPDVLNVLVDAATAATYRKIHGRDHFEQIIANVDQLCSVQYERQAPRPLIVCEMIKTHETMDEMEAFYDHWMRKTSSAVIAGPSNYAGQWPERSVVRMAPPTRFACMRLSGRAMVLADGRLTLCDQDFRGSAAAGSLRSQSLAELWTGGALADVRAGHIRGAWEELSLCCNCDEWHRP